MRGIFLLIFSLIFFRGYGSVAADTVVYDTLANGIRVVEVFDTTEENVYISFFARYRPITSDYFMGRDRIFAYLTGGRIINDNVFVRSVVCSADAVDSALRFIRDRVFRSQFRSAQVKEALVYLKQPSPLEDRAAELIAYPRSYPLSRRISEFMTPQQIAEFAHEFDLHDIVLVVRGRLTENVDSLAQGIFGVLSMPSQPGKGQAAVAKVPPRSNQGLYFVNVQDSSLRLGIVYPVAQTWPDVYPQMLLLKHFLLQYYPWGKFVFRSSVFGSYAGFFFRANRLREDLSVLLGRLNSLNSSAMSTVRRAAQAEMDSVLSDPWKKNELIYFAYLNGKGLDYKSALLDNLQKASFNDLKQKFTPVAIGNELLWGCDLLSLSSQYQINFTDDKIYRYRVLKKGFNANTIIDRYVNFVLFSRVPRRFFYVFEGSFFTDSVFLNIRGYVAKNEAGLYRFQTYLVTDSGNVFHSLILYDGKQWIDSSYYGSSVIDASLAQITQMQRYILSEMYFDRLGYKARIICEPELLVQNIYKIKIEASDSVYFYSYYDMATREKTQTIVYTSTGWKESFYYYNYQRIKKGRYYLKVPMVIVEQTPQYTFTLRLKDISFGHIRKKVFSQGYDFLRD